MSLLRETGQFIQYMQRKSPLASSLHDSKASLIYFDPLLQQHPLFRELINIYRLHLENGDGDGDTIRQFQMFYDRMRHIIPDVPEGQSPLLDQLIRLVCTQQFLSR